MICLFVIEIWPHEYRSKTKNLFYSMNLISAGWGSLLINNWNLSSDTAFNQLVSNGWISQRILFRLSSANKLYYQSVTLWRTFMMVTWYFHFRIGDHLRKSLFVAFVHKTLSDNMYCDDQHVYANILQWRHNERNGVSNHQPQDCLLFRLFNA